MRRSVYIRRDAQIGRLYGYGFSLDVSGVGGWFGDPRDAQIGRLYGYGFSLDVSGVGGWSGDPKDAQIGRLYDGFLRRLSLYDQE